VYVIKIGLLLFREKWFAGKVELLGDQIIVRFCFLALEVTHIEIWLGWPLMLNMKTEQRAGVVAKKYKNVYSFLMQSRLWQ